MLVLGFLLAAAGAVFGLDLLWKNKFRVPDPVVFGQKLGISSGRWLFLIGVLVGAAIILGFALMMGSLGRRRARAVAAHQDKNDQRAMAKERDSLQADNEQLRHQLDQQQARPAPVPARPDPVPASPPYRVGATSTEVAEDDPRGRP